MSLICKCPESNSLASVPLYSCPTTLGQVQKVIFMRIFGTNGKKNVIGTSSNDATKKAAWTANLTANDATKVVVSPYINAPATEPGAMRTYGGGNETLNGIEINMGTEPTSFSGNLLQENSKTIKALKTFTCERNLGVFLVDENGTIGGLETEVEGCIAPIPIHSFFVGDKNLGGYDAPDSNAISWKFKPNWSDDLVLITPEDFNALTELVVAE